jgi:hypothetical protein
MVNVIAVNRCLMGRSPWAMLARLDTRRLATIMLQDGERECTMVKLLKGAGAARG